MKSTNPDAGSDLTPQVERLLSVLLEQATDHAMLLFGVDERVLWASPGAETILGRSCEELVGVAAADMFLQEDVELGIPEQEFEIARSRGSAEDDRWSQRPDGSRFWATGLAYALRDRGGEIIGYGKIIQNRTDWKLRQETIVNRLRAVTDLDAHKNTLIATLAHELRNPLAPLMNATSMLREGMPADYPIRLIERQVDFIQRLVDDLLEATRASAGKLELKRERLLLQDVITAAVETVRPLLERHLHKIDLLATPGPIFVNADTIRLQQVFSNLLSNAAKYTHDGGNIWVRATTEDTDAVVRIEDNGIGIAPDMLLHIFELFAQVRTPATPDGGLGIGLSLVKELVNLHGGSVQANSDGIGKGSVFIVRLPLAQT
ncbi:MAG: PAS domain-containing sensor histidine kinase [Lautropia sp.]|nr:PAS domain-containing sensor histidine kinase [Lautropia sp.]